MDRKHRLSFGSALTVTIMFLFCMDLTASHSLSSYGGISANGWGRTVAQLFFEMSVDSSTESVKQARIRDNKELSHEVRRSHYLSDRHKLRWVYLSFLDSIISSISDLAQKQSRYPIGMLFLYLYSACFGVILFSTYMGLRGILILLEKGSDTRATYLSALSYTLVLSFIFFLHWRGGEYKYSVVEGFFVVAAMYLIFRHTKMSLLLYAIVCIAAPLVRESGLFISIFLTTYYLIVERKFVVRSLIYPVLALSGILLANLDIVKYIFDYGFLFSFEPAEGQVTWHDFFEFKAPGPAISVFYNFVIFLLPIVIFYERGNRIKSYFLVISLGYFLMLLIGTPIEHMSPRYMPALLLTIYALSGLTNRRSSSMF